MAQFSPMLAIANNIKGMDFMIPMSFNQFMDNSVFGKKGVADFKQIKSLAIGRYGSSSDFMGRFLLQTEGLKPESDVALLQFGNQTSRLLAVDAGRADAAIVTPPIILMARKKGLSLLIDASRLDHPPRLSDDVVNSVAGSSWLILNDEDTAASGFNARYHIANKPLLPVPYEPVYIGPTLTSPWASVLAQNAQGGVQVLAAFVTEVGGLRYHLEQQVIPWLRDHARFVFSIRQKLCGCYNDDMDMLTLQTLVASLENIAPWNWQQPSLQSEGRREICWRYSVKSSVSLFYLSFR